MHIAFDIETTGLDFEADNITCAATRRVNDDGTVAARVWHSDFAAQMTTESLVALVDYLHDAWLAGCEVVTFNGAKFDFAMVAIKLATEPGAVARVRQLAANHRDIMLQFTAEHGYYASMDSFARGCGLAPKTWDGAAAAEAWQTGATADKQKVLDYCGEDVRCLSDLYLYIKNNGHAIRVTRRGHRQHVPFPAFKSAREALVVAAANPPDTSWMDSPPDLFEGTAWMDA